MKYTTPVIKKDQPDDNYKFKPLPSPTGKYPYHLALSNIIPDTSADQLIFHMAGDTGSVRRPESQKGVIDEMAAQYLTANAPNFLYHLGDLVYHYGEALQYDSQFFKPYENYPGPIFAIAGNHDSDVNPDTPPYNSLDAFTKVFCDTSPHTITFSGNSRRKSMPQPNIYWTLETPLATIIGLHSNVPKYGVITTEQREWFIAELKAADPDKMLIVCVHHAPYSADINHGSSLYMISFLNGAYTETGIRPDIVFSGHVHNYQRFSKAYADGTSTPYIVAGAGGFDELHSIAAIEDERFTAYSPLFADVKLENYCDDRHGFLKITVTKENNLLSLTGEYYSVNPITNKALLSDSFILHKG
ncbi:metallophosphoesterase [Mucilaginibacter sp.]|jgi:predicted phosphodiesterase|uniref:metallophosphoesterase family protein n=1 Tax=Mucilaginibacter sp. TaxID=1882438 RepID=UPI00356550B1